MTAKDLYEEYWRRESPPPLADPLAPTRRRILWSLTGDDGAGRRLLDCGSGDGGLVGEAAARGFEAVGLEIAEGALERARAAYPDARFVRHAIEDRPWPVAPASFDYVVSFEVIEHLLRPADLLAGAYDALKPGGHLALTTPYHGLLKNLAIAVLAFDRHYDVEGDHIRFFSDRALERLLVENGFVVERKIHFGRFRGLWAGVFVWARKR